MKPFLVAIATVLALKVSALRAADPLPPPKPAAPVVVRCECDVECEFIRQKIREEQKTAAGDDSHE